MEGYPQKWTVAGRVLIGLRIVCCHAAALALASCTRCILPRHLADHFRGPLHACSAAKPLRGGAPAAGRPLAEPRPDKGTATWKVSSFHYSSSGSSSAAQQSA